MKLDICLTLHIEADAGPGESTPGISDDDRDILRRITEKIQSNGEQLEKITAIFIPALFNPGLDAHRQTAAHLNAPQMEELVSAAAAQISPATLQFAFNLYNPPENETPEQMRRRDAAICHLHGFISTFHIINAQLEVTPKYNRTTMSASQSS